MTSSDSFLKPGRWVPEICRALNDMIAAHGRFSNGFDATRPPLAVFDWDNTCARGDIGESVMDELDRRDKRDRWSGTRVCFRAKANRRRTLSLPARWLA